LKVEVKICSLADLYAASGIKQVDVVIYTTVVWPQPFVEEWEEANTLPCGTISISTKDPSWKLNLVRLYRDEFLYDPQVLLEYGLSADTEEDMLLQPRRSSGFWREIKQLEEFIVSVEAATDYSIGFMQFEWRNGYENLQNSANGDVLGFTLPLSAIVPTQSSKDQMIWEHKWDLSSTEAFRNRHTVSIQRSRRTATRNDRIGIVW